MMKGNVYSATALVAGTDLGLQVLSDAYDAVRMEVSDVQKDGDVSSEHDRQQRMELSAARQQQFHEAADYCRSSLREYGGGAFDANAIE